MRLNFKFMQTDGVPLTADLMETLEEAWSIFNVIGDIAGNLTILSGCEIVGTSVNPGIVVIDGDVLFFEGGTVYQNVFIHQEDITKVFKNQVAKVLIEKKTVKFGDAFVVYSWDAFTRLSTLKQIASDLSSYNDRLNILEMKTAPIINGGIAWAWFKDVSEIPLGWKECFNIQGKTIVGLDPNDPLFSTLGDPVGSKTQTLTIDHLPDHDHEVKGYAGVPSGIPTINSHINAPTNGASSPRTGKTGGNQPFNIIQPGIIANYIEPNFQ